MSLDIDYPIESETDIVFAISEVLNEAEANGVDPETARDAGLGYLRGRQTERGET